MPKDTTKRSRKGASLASGSPKPPTTQAAADTPSTKTPPATATPAGTQQEEDVVIQLQEAEEVEIPSDMSTTDADDNDDDADEEAADAIAPRTGPAQKKRRKKNPSVILSDENERLVGEWLEQEAEFIYNKGLTAYKDKAKVWRAFEEKGRTLDPPVSGHDLRTWFTSLRSRFGRLTAEKNGQGASRRLTDREKWILNIFHFLKPHIVRQKKPKMLRLPKSAQAASTDPGHATGLADPAKAPITTPTTQPTPYSSYEPSSAIDEPCPRKSRKQDELGTGVLEVVLQQAEAVRDRLQGVMMPVQDPNLSYWRAALDEFAKDCVGVGVDLRVPLKVEILSTIQRFVRATKEGITRPTRDLIPHSQAEMFWDCPPPAAPAPPQGLKKL